MRRYRFSFMTFSFSPLLLSLKVIQHFFRNKERKKKKVINQRREGFSRKKHATNVYSVIFLVPVCVGLPTVHTCI